ncbi:MAG: hypothetical protein H6700_12275 [Myxococcales bacterium]|nr:hypothetical protein [Myxococcales bacterium]
MKPRRSPAAVLVLTSLPLACWCGAEDGDEADIENPVPQALLDIEGTAEDAYDMALAGDVSAVAADAATISAGWSGFRGVAEAAGASASDLTAMDGAVAALVAAAVDGAESVALARVANGVSAPMDELFGLYEDPVPPSVLALDYLGREVVLDARSSAWGGAGSHVDAAATTFDGVRAALLAAGGTVETTDFDASVAAMRADITAQDAAKLEADANVALELVDGMEGVFTASEAAHGEQPD